MTALLVAALFLVAFAIPYHAPRVGMIAGLAGMVLATAMMLQQPVSIETGRSAGPGWVDLDFDLTRPIGIALALYSILWLVIASVQLLRTHAATSVA